MVKGIERVERHRRVNIGFWGARCVLFFMRLYGGVRWCTVLIGAVVCCGRYEKGRDKEK